MKCPYAVSRNTITNAKLEYNEEGQQIGYFESQMNKAVFVDCLQENCGAYQDGKCCYKG